MDHMQQLLQNIVNRHVWAYNSRIIKQEPVQQLAHHITFLLMLIQVIKYVFNFAPVLISLKTQQRAAFSAVHHCLD